MSKFSNNRFCDTVFSFSR